MGPATLLSMTSFMSSMTSLLFLDSGPRRYQGDKRVLSMQQGGIRSTRMYHVGSLSMRRTNISSLLT